MNIDLQAREITPLRQTYAHVAKYIGGDKTASRYQEGYQRGFSQYVVAEGEGFAKACELAQRIAGNAPLSNFAVTQALPRIADLSQPDGLFVESLMSAIAQSAPEAKSRVRAFLEGRAAKVQKA